MLDKVTGRCPPFELSAGKAEHTRSRTAGYCAVEMRGGGDAAPTFASAAGRLSKCSLQGRIKRAEKLGPVPIGQRSRSAGIRSELT